jgi:hypothetical protein
VVADGGKVDALLDLVSYEPETCGKFARAVRSGGKVASTSGGATPEALEAADLTGQVVMAAPNRARLTRLLSEIERGSVRVEVEETVPLDAARARSRHSRAVTPKARSSSPSTADCPPTGLYPRGPRDRVGGSSSPRRRDAHSDEHGRDAITAKP